MKKLLLNVYSKKTKNNFLRTFSLSLLLAFSLANSVYGQCPVPTFYDGFESGSYTPNWTLGNGGAYAASTGGAAVGNYKVEGLSSSTNHLNGLVATLAAVTPTYISWYMKPTSAVASNYVVFGDNTLTAANCICFCYYNTSQISFVSGTTYSYPTGVGVWVRIELKNVNYTARTYDIWINGTQVQTAFPFRTTTQSNITQFHIYAYNTGNISNWDDIQLGQGALPPSISTSSVQCNGASTATASALNLGQVAPLTYSWTGSASTTSVATNLAAGNYTVTINDANNCVRTQTLSIIQPSSITAVATSTNILCFGLTNGKVAAQASGGVGPYTYSWAPSGGTNPTAQNLAPGTYTSLISDSHNCTQSVTAIVTAPAAALAAALSQTNVNCRIPLGISTVAGSGGTAPYTYLWSPWGGTSAQMTNLPAGSHTVELTDANGCKTTHPLTITADLTAPAVTAVSSSSSVCKAAPATISVTGTADTYLWNTGSTSTTITGTSATATVVTYSVTGTNTSNGCTASSSIVQYVLNCTGITTLENTNSAVSVYPNPNSGEFIINLNSASAVVIYNALGELVLSGTLNEGKNIIGLHEQANGVYFIKITEGGKQEMIRVIKN